LLDVAAIGANQSYERLAALSANHSKWLILPV
jgi:hypothetical protein